jgi:hypothetical protein
MLKNYKFFSIVLVSFLISSCAHDTDPKNMAVGTIPDAYFGKYENAMAVGTVTGGEKTSPVGKPRISNESFADALKDSLAANGLLNESNPKYLLSANITNMYQPLIGKDIDVNGRIVYKIKDVRRNIVVYSKTVDSRSNTTQKEKQYYVSQMKMSNEGTIKASIESFLSSLSVPDTSYNTSWLNDNY